MPFRPVLAPLAVSLMLSFVACGPKLIVSDDAAEDAMSESGNSESGEAPAAVTTAPAPGDGSSGDDASDDEAGTDPDDPPEPGVDPSCAFICEPDAGDGPVCDVFAQDCPEGEKCMPWASDGDSVWNATRCSPIDEEPGEVGDPCTVEGSGTSGIDDCDHASVCWNVDAETNEGTCVAMCLGDVNNPICEHPDTNCAVTNEGTLALCLPECHPLMEECDEGQACYPMDGVDFVCAPDVSGEAGTHGDACDSTAACDPGHTCVAAEQFSECDGQGCCAVYCDAASEGADAECGALDAGQVCVPWYAQGQAPPGYETAGICAIP